MRSREREVISEKEVKTKGRILDKRTRKNEVRNAKSKDAKREEWRIENEEWRLESGKWRTSGEEPVATGCRTGTW